MTSDLTVVYESNAGHTYQYAQMLADRLEVPALELAQAKRQLPRGSRVVFLGWIFAGSVKGGKKALQLFDVVALVGCGMGANGSQVDDLRRNTPVPDHVPVTTIQGGLELSRLSGPYKLALSMASKALKKAEEQGETADDCASEQDRAMREAFRDPRNHVSQANADLLYAWLQEQLG
ncbi:MAG: hypothetical protein Q4D06_05415 [Coriobacteriia bacterium]|nr:hypothetical protein [Coriobacteriia bacterium]